MGDDRLIGGVGVTRENMLEEEGVRAEEVDLVG